MGISKDLPGNCGKPPDYQEKVRRRFSRDCPEVKVARRARMSVVTHVRDLLRVREADRIAEN
jgi:hypothetical protein